MRSELRSKVFARHRAVTKALAQALREAEIDAVDAREFLDGIQFVGGTVEDVAQARTLVAWDVDYIDPECFPLKDHRGVLVIRISDDLPVDTLVQRIVRLMCALKNQGTPRNIVVLEPVTPSGQGGSFASEPKAAA